MVLGVLRGCKTGFFEGAMLLSNGRGLNYRVLLNTCLVVCWWCLLRSIKDSVDSDVQKMSEMAALLTGLRGETT